MEMKMPNYESQRLKALKRLNILDTPPDERFEALARIARAHYGLKAVLFSLIDEERQWIKSSHMRNGCQAPIETSRSVAFCDYTIQQDKAFIVEDATQDPRFRDNILVTAEPRIRFYAGLPVREPSGFKIGALCLIDDKPRTINESELDVLKGLTRLVEEEVARAYTADVRNDFIGVSQLNMAIQRAQNVFLATDDQAGAFEVMLNDLLLITGSQFGFIGDTLYKENGDPYLKARAISNIAWSPETHALYQEVERRGMTFERLDTLIGEVLVTKAMVVANEVTTDPRRGGLPPGHPPVNTYCGIPIFAGSKFIGMVALGNRENGYSERLAAELEPLLQTIGQLIERKRLYQERSEYQEKLEAAANYDALTGLPNRRRLTEFFQKELVEANQRQGIISVCFIDIDGFKAVNDEHGHAVGDIILKSVADNLTAALRAHDLVARFGGDEFVAILRDVEDEQIYARILDAFRQPISFNGHVFGLSGSMGVTIYPQDNADTDILLRHADQAMYSAKMAGKNQYRIFDTKGNLSQQEKIKVFGEIDQAIAERQLELFYQPKIDLSRGKVAGFEALIRWNHPEKGLLGPAAFLPYLEFTEYAAAVGRFVMSEVVGRLAEWEQNGLDYSLSLNLSPSHFLGDEFRDDLFRTLDGCSEKVKTRLILEILETTALDASGKVHESLAACRSLGIDVSLDDFGIGYSSLDYFRRLPVQEIKIDRSFIKDMLKDPDDEKIVKAIIGLSENFGRRIVAEGIEEEAIQDRLVNLGCNLVQGFYYSKPQPLNDALKWAREFEQAL